MANQQKEYPVSTLRGTGTKASKPVAHETRTTLEKALLSRISADNPEN